MVGLRIRILIRLLVAFALGIALLAGAAAPAPEDLPALALQQDCLYRLEIALLVFYGSLLIITPAVSGLAWGRLPTEISTRGAKFAEEADRSADLGDRVIRKLELDLEDLADGLGQVEVEINQLKGKGDNR